MEHQSSDRLEAELFHFGVNHRSMGASFFRLDPGLYQWTLTCGESIVEQGGVNQYETETSISFSLPPKQSCTLEVESK